MTEYQKQQMTDREVRAYFDRYTDGNESYFEGRNYEAYTHAPEVVVEFYRREFERDPESALDMGAANGAWLAGVGECVSLGRSLGVELYSYPIEHALPGVEIIQGDINSWPMPATGYTYDVVCVNATAFIDDPTEWFQTLRKHTSRESLAFLTFDPLVAGRVRVTADDQMLSGEGHVQTVLPNCWTFQHWQLMLMETGWQIIHRESNQVVVRRSPEEESAAPWQQRWFFPSVPNLFSVWTGSGPVFNEAPTVEFWNPVLFRGRYDYLLYQPLADDPTWILDLSGDTVHDRADLDQLLADVVQRRVLDSIVIVVYDWPYADLPLDFTWVDRSKSRDIELV